MARITKGNITEAELWEMPPEKMEEIANSTRQKFNSREFKKWTLERRKKLSELSKQKPEDIVHT